MKNQIPYVLLLCFLWDGFCLSGQTLPLFNSSVDTGMEKQKPITNVDTSGAVIIAREYVLAHLSDWGLTVSDVDEMTINDMYTDKKTGITRIYFLQRYEGIPVSHAILNVSIDRTGKVFFAGNRFETEIETKINTTVPNLSPMDAVILLASHLGVMRDEPKSKMSKKESQYIFDKGNMASDDITAELAYQPYNGKLRLTWDILFSPINNNDKWSTRVDAITGEVLDEYNLTVYCSSRPMSINEEDYYCIEQTQSLNSSSTVGTSEPLYNVWPVPVESPYHGQRVLTTAPIDTLASPFGWHDTNGQPGPEYYITRGNNIHAFQDQSGVLHSANDEPHGGANLVFDFPFDPAMEATQYVDASVVNLFYTTNYMHDFAYHFGFDEVAGNFQQNNYGKGGTGGDALDVMAQQGWEQGNVNNANYYHGLDGTSSEIRMYVCESTRNFLRVDEPISISGMYRSSFPGSGWGNGAYVTDVPVSGEVVQVNDGVEDPYVSDACEPIINAAELNGKIAMIDRGGCEFGWKALKAQEAGAIAVLVCNINDDDFTMNVGNYGANVQIPILMIGSSDCEVISQYIGNGLKVTFVDPGQNGPETFDSDLDNSLIIHEFGHAISIRIIGGPSFDCLDNAEQMGEGWSDFFSLVTTVLPGDRGEKKRGIAIYSARDAITGKGFRRFPYSTDMTIMPLTYSDISASTDPHNIGEVWCAALWDMYWAFAERYGWSENPYEEWSGNYKAIRLVFEGLKNTPCSPGFIDGRNAILAADESLFNGENQCMIWEAFARRGIGYSASQGSPFDSGDQKEAFDLPPVCTNKIIVEKSVTDFIQPGDNIEVTIKIGNYKLDSVTNVMVTDEIPDGTSYKINSASLPVDIGGNIISFDVGDLKKNEEKIITYTLTSDADAWSERKFLDTVGVESNINWQVYTMGTEASNDWSITSNYPAHSGIHSWLSREVPERSRQVLELKPDAFTFHVDGDHPALRFFHRYQTQGGRNGGIIEVKETNSENWHPVNDNMLRNGYTTVMEYLTFISPNLKAFSGYSGNQFKATYVDLSPWAGKDIHLRFRFGTIDTISGLGWQIDDIEFMNMLSYNSEVCVTSDQGDYECAIAPESGTIVDTKESTVSTTNPLETLHATIYPNPAQDIITIQLFMERGGLVDVRLLSVDGKIVLNHSFTASSNGLLNIDTDKIPDGLYFVHLMTEEDHYVEKVVIQK